MSDFGQGKARALQIHLAGNTPWTSLLQKAAPVRGVGEESTENGSMQQVGGLMGTLRGYKHPEWTVRTAGEPSTLLPSPQGMAEGLLQIHHRYFPFKKGLGFACAMALGVQSHLLCHYEEFYSD